MSAGVDTFIEALNEASSIDVDISQADIDELVTAIEDSSSAGAGTSSVSNSDTGSNGALTVELEISGRSFGEVYYNTNGAGEVVIETSNTGNQDTWRELDRFDVSQTGTDNEANEQFPWLGRKFFRARIVGDSGSVELDIAAS